MLHGNGTTLQSIIDAIENKTLSAKICVVVSDHEDAYALQRAKNASIATYVIKAKTTKEIDEELQIELQKSRFI